MAKAGDGRRVPMIEKQVLQSVASYISRHLARDYESLVTVTKVKMPADLKTGRVFVSILGLDGEPVTEKLQDLVIEDLSEKAPEIQKAVDQELKLRFCPRLSFEIDESLEKSLHVENLLRNLGSPKLK